MNQRMQQAYDAELSRARSAMGVAAWGRAFYHLENAHVLGQKSARCHTLSHWWMLRWSLRTHNYRELVGQIPRIGASLLFSKIWVPVGNTGGSNVSAFRPMPIRQELEQYFG